MKRLFASLMIFGLGLVAANPVAPRRPAAIVHAAEISDTPLFPAAQLERDDPAVDRLVSDNPILERIATGFTWTEGPLWLPSQQLIFAEIPSNSIRLWNPTAGLSTFLQPSGYQGTEPYGGPEPGSNAMALDAAGRLTVAGHAQRDVFRIESRDLKDPKASHTILADSYRGKRLNSPNDLVYRSDGSLYFTDPPFGLRTQSNTDPAKELKINGVYRIPNASGQKPGSAPAPDQLQLVIADLPFPNGLAFSPDEKYLYVDSSLPRMQWWRYTVQPDGALTEAKLLYDAGPWQKKGAPDGMKVDEQGNLYSAGPGGVWIFSPQGKRLGLIAVPEIVGNLAWGGADRKTLFIAASTSIYRVQLKVAGAAPRWR